MMTALSAGPHTGGGGYGSGGQPGGGGGRPSGGWASGGGGHGPMPWPLPPAAPGWPRWPHLRFHRNVFGPWIFGGPYEERFLYDTGYVEPPWLVPVLLGLVVVLAVRR